METSLKYEQSTWENFKFHSKRAMKKTVTSFVCLAILMIISFIVSSYEYNEVHDQYQTAFKKANAMLGKKPQQNVDHQIA